MGESNNFYEIGLRLVKEKKFREAMPFFRKCLIVNPGNEKAYYQLSPPNLVPFPANGINFLSFLLYGLLVSESSESPSDS